MDMKKFLAATYATIEDVRLTTLLARIMDVREGKFGKPELVLDSGLILSVNATNMRTLFKAYGPESLDYIGKEVELFAGETVFEGETRESVLIRPISASNKTEAEVAEAAVAAARAEAETYGSDDIPF